MSERFHDITISVNGEDVRESVDARTTLVDFLRETAGLTGSHVGCEHGVCGACTILWDDQPVRSCLVFAIQADGARLRTVEGLAPSETELHPIQEAFWEAHGLQCGFCTPGMILSAYQLLQRNARPTEAEIRHAFDGNLCRCTGYQHIVDAVQAAARQMKKTTGPRRQTAARKVNRKR